MGRSGGTALAVHAAVLAAYAALAVLYSWPLPAHLGTHLMGSPAGDTGTYFWNQWLFRREFLAGNALPLMTSQILALAAKPADLSLHNYTVFANLLSLPLQERLGLVASFNVVYLLLRVSSAYALFLLASRIVGRGPEAFLAGALFGFSPFLTARGMAHFSLVAAAPLPLFLLLLRRADDDRRRRWAVAAGLTLGWSGYCDPYYLVFCSLLLVLALGHAWFRVVAEPRVQWRSIRVARRVALGCAAGAAAVYAAILAGGGGQLVWGDLKVTFKSLYTPALALVLALLAGAWSTTRLRLLRRTERSPAADLRRAALGLAAAVVVLSPLLAALARTALGGLFVAPAIPWRSSPPGVDLLALLMPNPSHALFGEPFRSWLARERADGFVENAASLTLTALAVLGAALLARRRPPVAWVALTLFFAALALGPFVRVGGFNTALPTPWTLLRYLPGVGLARSPSRFAVLAVLGVSVLFAWGLRELTARLPAGRRRAALAAIALLLAFELAPLPRTLHSASVPSVYALIAADRCDVRVLEVPFGLRDGTRSVGDFSALSQFHQVFHGKPLVGGYLSRMSELRVAEYRRLPTLRALIALSERAPLEPAAAERARAAAPGFVERGRIGFVVVQRARASRKLRRFAVEALALERELAEGDYELWIPRGAPHAPDCPLRAPPLADRAAVQATRWPEPRRLATRVPAP